MQSPVVDVESKSAELPHPPTANLNYSTTLHQAGDDGLDSRPAKILTKIMLVQFRSEESVGKHPELQNFLEQGWSIRSAVPRIVESEGTKLLVVMARPESSPRLTRIK
ncbi:MAG: hypothetical protein WD275_09345 [Rhodothermales bacterium]